MHYTQRTATLAVTTVLLLGVLASGETTRKEYRFKVGHRASLSIINQYGPISVKSGSKKEVVVVAVLYSDKVEIDQTRSGNRLALASHLLDGADANLGRVDYEVQVPADASVILHSSTGSVHVEKIRGDIEVEGNTANVDVRDVSSTHVHIKTLNGAVTLANLREGHVEVTSVSGDVSMTAVNGPMVHVNSSSGKINYDGDFGGSGEYSLTSHTGDIEATAPSYASIDVVVRSAHGKVINDFILQPEHMAFAAITGSAFAGTIGNAASSVKLLSFSGRIHLKKR